MICLALELHIYATLISDDGSKVIGLRVDREAIKTFL